LKTNDAKDKQILDRAQESNNPKENMIFILIPDLRKIWPKSNQDATSLTCPDQVWGLPNLLFKEYQSPFPAEG
jgi:hypothetical protein